MTRELTFGIITIQNAEWPEMVRRWQHIEELGFDTIWVADHFVNPRTHNDLWLEAWTLISALATQTSRIRFGTLVTQMGMRNPALLARQALTVDYISGGRLEVGLGSGQQGDPGTSMMGPDDWDAPERVARFHEYVEIVDGMLRNKVTTYDGHYYRVEGAVMNPRPSQQPRPPLTIAALGPKMLEITARYADRWNTYGGRGVSAEQAVGLVRQRNQTLDEICEQIGRDPGEISRSMMAFGATAGTNPFQSVDAFNDYVGQYREVGMNDFVFYYPPQEWYPPSSSNYEQVFEKVAAEVIPGMKNEKGLA